MLNILLVDDDNEFRAMLRETLTDAGHKIYEAPDGKAALDLYQDRAIDLIIIDLIMPVKEGIQTIVEFRHIAPKVTIIAVSGGNRLSNSNLVMAQKLGADFTLAKPFYPQEILALIHQILTQKAAPC